MHLAVGILVGDAEDGQRPIRQPVLGKLYRGYLIRRRNDRLMGEADKQQRHGANDARAPLPRSRNCLPHSCPRPPHLADKACSHRAGLWQAQCVNSCRGRAARRSISGHPPVATWDSLRKRGRFRSRRPPVARCEFRLDGEIAVAGARELQALFLPNRRRSRRFPLALIVGDPFLTLLCKLIADIVGGLHPLSGC